ncbi:MAG TPA: phenylalanine--tRNA ligase subunit alpha [Planctomycetota bacterium]|jgi:phenylalanyl-tRNA synthetase alpha chain|nr:phenylalanine--tRNA ligase subunit alpha [Planctomycetota bacterium]
MSQSLVDSIARIEAKAHAAIAAAAGANALDELQRIERAVLDKGGELNQILRGLKDLDAAGRRDAGQAANESKERLAAALAERRRAIADGAVAAALAAERIDPTQPGPRRPLGHEHPVKSVMRELDDLFESMGFTVVDGPEVETDFFNFEALNIPPNHPARDAQDTFYVEGDNVLRTHTSGMQVRAMRKYGAPLRLVAPGRVFRNETQDAGHEHTFHQLEGLMVDEGISIGHLKGVLEQVLARLVGGEVRTRLRPHYFPFVEPGLELDFQCRICGGAGCSTCKRTGWIEICGCGMVHPKVLAAGNVDPEKYSGFAFGLGIDRLTMMRHAIPDIRWLMSGDLRFLRQFK